MKIVSKTIALKLKQAREKEKRGDKAKIGTKMHRNLGEITNVQEIGENQTFNQLHGGAQGDAETSARKH